MVRTWLDLATALVLSVAVGASLTPAMPELAAQALVLLAVLVAAAPMGRAALHAVPPAGVRALLPQRRAAAVPLVLAGRTTDVVHHPLRPRAPGLV
ncbi:hypothetical protein KDN32_15470 [Nocardioides sp. J2M5]|uniref:hypothetical protein n=1 Tax=Nocardioides palaemonis TaxID=2829810 RepID=UPI001BA7B386|nr:hypothetical protein [Nocardioides palaemonis]MBS2939139.1 hypothetical protein [Nocardioides palaemonis]